MIRLLGLLCAVVLLWSPPARADDNRPLTIQIEQAADGAVSARWKIPPYLAAGQAPALTPPANCAAAPQIRRWSDSLGHWQEVRWDCAGPLSGTQIGLEWPGFNPGLATIARIEGPQGRVETVLLAPDETLLTVPPQQELEEASGFGTFQRFVGLGFDHILEGWDHLLFVSGLIIVAGTWRRILVTVSGFTLAHSATLALAALDLVRLPPRAVEAAIALSIVFLAVEIARGRRDTLTWRRPVAVASVFGLLHGFGFASVLREVGLPDGALIEALLAFNIGIEIGQVVFALLVFIAITAARKLAPTASGAQVVRLAAYGLGITASYWLFERLLLP